MPTYAYECEACGHGFEAFESMTSKPQRTCPECGKPKLRRLIGAGAGIIFKGSGFYQTDYRSPSYSESAKKEADAGSAGSKAKEEGGADAKASEPKATEKPQKKTKAPKAAGAEKKPKGE
jgi:putative FmdB family regulatory protein